MPESEKKDKTYQYFQRVPITEQGIVLFDFNADCTQHWRQIEHCFPMRKFIIKLVIQMQSDISNIETGY